MSTADLDQKDRHPYLARRSEPFRSLSKELVNHPPHYNQGQYETIDVIEDWDLDFNCGNAIKYISRHMHKGTPIRDIEKAIWYLNRRLKSLKKGEEK